jgi:hypothetical protein
MSEVVDPDKDQYSLVPREDLPEIIRGSDEWLIRLAHGETFFVLMSEWSPNSIASLMTAIHVPGLLGQETERNNQKTTNIFTVVKTSNPAACFGNPCLKES